jgi:hypothetical protein
LVAPLYNPLLLRYDPLLHLIIVLELGKNIPLTSVPKAEIVRGAVGVLVPIPMFPLPLTNNILEEAGESTRSRAADEAPEIWRDADGVIVPIPTDPEFEI